MIFDPVYMIMMVPVMILALIASIRVKGTFNKWSKVPISSGMSGAEAAAAMLRAANLDRNVSIEKVSGFLSDHYDPKHKVLRLSPDVYNGRSVASVGVACHEVGHAIQDARNYSPLVIRNAIVPMASFGSNLSWILIFAGMIIAPFRFLAIIGFLLFAMVVIFQFVNLPVEFNASRRAKEYLPQLGVISGPREAAGVSSVLGAAAMTYVAGTITALVQLLYWAYVIFGRRD